MEIGDIVKNRDGEELVILEVNSTGTYPIRAERVKDFEIFSFTLEGKFYEKTSFALDLIVDGEVCEAVSIPDETDTVLITEIETDTIFEPFEEACIKPVGETKSDAIEVYKSSLKATKVDVSILITKLISEDADVQNILLKLKILKKLLEL